MGADMPMDDSAFVKSHCHECWKYTDEVTREDNRLRAAVMLVANGTTLAVENSDAFKAADAYLKAFFEAALAPISPYGLPRR